MIHQTKVNSRSSDNTLVRKILNWSPETSIEQGMGDFLNLLIVST